MLPMWIASESVKRSLSPMMPRSCVKDMRRVWWGGLGDNQDILGRGWSTTTSKLLSEALQELETEHWTVRISVAEEKYLCVIFPFRPVTLTLSRSFRRAILLVTSSWAKSSFSCSNLMLASCRRLFSRWRAERNQLQTQQNQMETTISQS